MSEPADAPELEGLAEGLRKLAGEPNSPELRKRVEEDVRRAMEAVSRAVGDVSRRIALGLGDGRDRRTRRDDLAGIFFTQIETDDRKVRFAAAALAAYMFEPFLYGIPEDFDPRAKLSLVPDDVLEAVCRRFGWGEGFPSNILWLERMRRREQIKDWDFARTSETSAEVRLSPNQPAEFIEISFDVADAGAEEISRDIAEA